jgi:tRNA pseudouridine32 synthase/23S rRNA pseudouridine746 synthase
MTDWASLRDGRVILEDDDVLVLNKPAGISVVGERHDTDLLRVAKDAGERLMPVHRIDKVTSGLVVLAKNTAAHSGLTRQFTKRGVEKSYLAITRSTGMPERGTVDLPLFTASSGRVRVGAERADIRFQEADRLWTAAGHEFEHVRTFPSRTTLRRLWADDQHTVVIAHPVTGRRHQIRVHLAWIGHPIDGDPLFDRTAAARGARTALHAWRLSIDATWRDGARLTLTADPDDQFWVPLRASTGNAPDTDPVARVRALLAAA